MSNIYKMKYHIVIVTACRRVCNTVTNTSKNWRITNTTQSFASIPHCMITTQGNPDNSANLTEQLNPEQGFLQRSNGPLGGQIKATI